MRDRRRIRAVYDIEAVDPSRAAAGPAGEQSSGRPGGTRRSRFVPVAPLCAADAVLTGWRVVLEGGQVGPPDLFRRFAREGAA